jgi:hypothetical protein
VTQAERKSGWPRESTGAPVLNVISTLSDLRLTVAAGEWPGKGLAARAGMLATSDTPTRVLLRIADDQYMKAARLWLQVAYHLDDDEQLEAVLSLSAHCASLGGNDGFARNCMTRARAAAEHSGAASSKAAS